MIWDKLISIFDGNKPTPIMLDLALILVFYDDNDEENNSLTYGRNNWRVGNLC